MICALHQALLLQSSAGGRTETRLPAAPRGKRKQETGVFYQTDNLPACLPACVPAAFT